MLNAELGHNGNVTRVLACGTLFVCCCTFLWNMQPSDYSMDGLFTLYIVQRFRVTIYIYGVSFN